MRHPPSHPQLQSVFAVRSNVFYNGEIDDAAPTNYKPLHFHPDDFLHVVRKVNKDWWLARLVGGGAEVGMIPSPAHFTEKLALAPSSLPTDHNDPDSVTENTEEGDSGEMLGGAVKPAFNRTHLTLMG